MSNTITVYYPQGNSQFRNQNTGKFAQTSSFLPSRIISDWPDTTIQEGEAVDYDTLELTPIAGIDPNDIGRFISVDTEGNLIIVTKDGKPLKVQNLSLINTQESMLKELVKMNIHFHKITDEKINEADITLEGVE
ncbi:hypothetical protein LCGC14_1687360 [marine sediment metagenome]|uniref:Uncharacterized protein n=1 Tax=marine sediment metagenome TaxID=412755 RepID=A0A0F9HLY2_9ZZZZ